MPFFRAHRSCHWGRCTDSDDSSCPSTECEFCDRVLCRCSAVPWVCPPALSLIDIAMDCTYVERSGCPFNWYRSSGDINAGHSSWYSNLQTTIRFQSWEQPVSQPGCWAYPDMLEVGRVSGTEAWNRAHFGAWCVVSAPLVLGMDLTDEKLAPVLDVIGNKNALKVNQAWAGHPGSLVRTLPPAPAPAPGPAPPPGTYAVGVKCDPKDDTQVCTFCTSRLSFSERQPSCFSGASIGK